MQLQISHSLSSNFPARKFCFWVFPNFFIRPVRRLVGKKKRAEFKNSARLKLSPRSFLPLLLRNYFAIFAMFCGVSPKASISSGKSAEKPKSFVPTNFEAYLYQGSATPASTAVRFWQDFGRTSSL